MKFSLKTAVLLSTLLFALCSTLNQGPRRSGNSKVHAKTAEVELAAEDAPAQLDTSAKLDTPAGTQDPKNPPAENKPQPPPGHHNVTETWTTLSDQVFMLKSKLEDIKNKVHSDVAGAKPVDVADAQLVEETVLDDGEVKVTPAHTYGITHGTEGRPSTFSDTHSITTKDEQREEMVNDHGYPLTGNQTVSNHTQLMNVHSTFSETVSYTPVAPQGEMMASQPPKKMNDEASADESSEDRRPKQGRKPKDGEESDAPLEFEFEDVEELASKAPRRKPAPESESEDAEELASKGPRRKYAIDEGAEELASKARFLY